MLDDALFNNICDYDFTKVKELEKSIAKSLNTKWKYVHDVRLKLNYTVVTGKLHNNIRWKTERILTNKAHNYVWYRNSLSGPFEMKCIKCNSIQQFHSKSSLLRVLGYDDKGNVRTKETDEISGKLHYGQKNIGMCSECSRTAKRTPHGPRTAEQIKRMREISVLNQTEYNSVEEWAKAKRKKKDWYDICDRMSKQNLRKYKPDEYKRLMANRWDGTNFETGLTIEHSNPKSVCYKENKLLECVHSDNLKVVTMKENNQLWNEYVKKKIH